MQKCLIAQDLRIYVWDFFNQALVSRLPNELRHFAVCIVNLSSGQFGLFWFLFSKKIHYIIIATETLMYSK